MAKHLSRDTICQWFLRKLNNIPIDTFTDDDIICRKEFIYRFDQVPSSEWGDLFNRRACADPLTQLLMKESNFIHLNHDISWKAGINAGITNNLYCCTNIGLSGENLFETCCSDIEIVRYL